MTALLATSIVLRLATVAPDGTSWARELKAFARAVEAGTAGEVRVRWYFGGIAGNEVEMGRRIAREQLDGAASGHALCEQAAPAMRVARIAGLLRTRAEAAHVMQRLLPTFQQEAQQAGYALLGVVGLGPDLVFSRQPVRSLADLRRLRLWQWDVDEVGRAMTSELGMSVVALPLEDASRAYEQSRLDGFLAPPTVALAFQWSQMARYLTDLPVGYHVACVVVANRVFDRLKVEHQQTLRAQVAQLAQRIEDVGARQDAELVGGLFQRQGIKLVPAGTELRNDFLQEANNARWRVAERWLHKGLLDRVVALLVEYRK